MKPITKLLLPVALFACSTYSFATTRPVKADSIETVSISHKLSAFHNLHIQGPFDVVLTQGNDESIKFDAPTEVKDRIVAGVSGRTLEIQNKHDNWGTSEKSWYSDKSW